ncbi:hypothetical protein [Hymenobacter fodinae]|nr:hypothetical protein [Hymenobacter fodinae]
MNHTGLGQVITADSSRVSYEEEEAQSDFNLKERYNYLVRSKVEETQLWKLGLNDVGFDFGRFRYGIYLIYERKLRTSFSVLGELNPTAQPGYRYIYDPNTNIGGLEKTRYLNLGAQIAGRYYYNLNKRIRKGKSANNFSADYLSASIKTNGAYIPRNTHNNTYSGGDPKEYLVEVPQFSVRYGLQRRLGRYGFVDGNLGLATDMIFLARYPRQYYSWRSAIYGVGEFRIGLALGK